MKHTEKKGWKQNGQSISELQDNFELHTHTCEAKVDQLMGGHFDHGRVNDFLL